MPLKRGILYDELLNWFQQAPANPIDSARLFAAAYNGYSLRATCGGIPLIPTAQVPATGAMIAVMAPVLVSPFIPTSIPWETVVARGILAYWNAIVVAQGFGPTVIAPVAGPPSPATPPLSVVSAAGMAGLPPPQVANLLATSLDTWTRLLTCVIATTPTPLI